MFWDKIARFYDLFEDAYDGKANEELCQGGQMCDFCFVRHRKGEVWERSKSV